MHRGFTSALVPVAVEGEQFVQLKQQIELRQNFVLPYAARFVLGVSFSTPIDTPAVNGTINIAPPGEPVFAPTVTLLGSLRPVASPGWSTYAIEGFRQDVGTLSLTLASSGGTAFFDNLSLALLPAASVLFTTQQGGGVAGGRAVLSVATGGQPTVSVQWKLLESDDVEVDLVDGPVPGLGFVSGATTPTLTISSLFPGDKRLRVVATNACGSDNQDLILQVQPGCDIDFNNDELFPSDDDLLDFLRVLAGGPCSSPLCDSIDFDGDGLFPSDEDLVAYLLELAGQGGCN
jgi:hypothetical protein